MAQIEPMDIDSEFDNKENSLHHSNVLPRTLCTEKGYEELDASELNMKLRYSITPASSPMSKSFTANILDNRTFDNEDYINNVVINENCNLTRSLNSTITRNDMAKLPKSLPLQVLSAESVTENRNTSVPHTIEMVPKVQDINVTVTLSSQNYLDDNMSLPSTSSSVAQTPEATTPTKEIPKHDGGSPIMRGLKSVLNMFRSSQSPIPPEDVNSTLKQEILSPKEPALIDGGTKLNLGMASTPISNKQSEICSSQRSSPLKESIVFNDDLERELQWKDETTILFKEDKLPIHKLLLPQSLSSIPKTGEAVSLSNTEKEFFNNTVEEMDISYNDSILDFKVGRPTQSANITNTNDPLMIESDGEFVDCETTINNDISENKITENLTSLNKQNITFEQSQSVSEVYTEQSIDSKQTESLKNLPLKESTNNKAICNNQKSFPNSVINIHDLKSNTGEVLMVGNKNEIVSQIFEEKNIYHKIRQFNETELVNTNGPDKSISTGAILSEYLTKEQEIKIKDTVADLKHPSNIPLPDEDDVENVLNYFPITMAAVKQQELNLKTELEMDMSIDHNETSLIEQECSPCKVINDFDLDKNNATVKEMTQVNNQNIVVNANNDEICNAQSINTKDNIQTVESSNNLTHKIENAPLEVTISMTHENGKSNIETNAKIITDSFELSNEKPFDAVSIEDKTKCDVSINQTENNTVLLKDNYQSITMEYLNKIEINNETNLHMFEKNNIENMENIDCMNHLASDKTFFSLNNDGKDCGSIGKLLVNLSKDCSESNFQKHPLGNSVTENYTDIINAENIPIDISKSEPFIQQEDKNFEININISQEVQKPQDMETILQSKCSLELDNTLDILKENNAAADYEKSFNIKENIESTTLDKEMLNIGSANKTENLMKEEDKEMLLKEVINTKEENCIGRSTESEIAFEHNANEFSGHISPTNEIFDMSVSQEAIFKNKEVVEKTDEFDHNPNKIYIQVHDKEKEVVNSNNSNNLVHNETVCHTELVNRVIPNVNSVATFNKSIDREDDVEYIEIKQQTDKCHLERDSINLHILGSESLDNSTCNIVIPNETGECGLKQQSDTVCNPVPEEQVISNAAYITFNPSICQKEELEDKKNEGTAYECKQEIDTLDMSQENKMLDSMLNKHNLTVINSKIDDNVTSNVASNETFNMSIDLEDVRENEEIREKMSEFQVDETGECAINEQNVTICKSKLNDCSIFNVKYIADDKKEENKLLNHLTSQTHLESENIEPVFLPERRSSLSNNESIKGDVKDQRNNLDNKSKPLKLDYEMKNDQLMDTSLKVLKISSQNMNENIGSENFKQKSDIDESEKNIEIDDCLTKEIICQVSPPLSPVISSKGYNFNFDEIDDPFATKTKIRSSSPQEDCPGSNEIEIRTVKSTNVKKDFQRRKSMPIKRQQISLKSKINSTFSEAIDYKEMKQNTKTTEEAEAESAITNAICDNSQVSENIPSTIPEMSSVKITELPPCQTEETYNYTDGLENNENVHKLEVQYSQTETVPHEFEIMQIVSNPTILSIDKREAKNVFNLPEMSTDMNFSPFATKSKVCRTPSPVLEAGASSFKAPANLNESGSHAVNPNDNIKSDVEKLHDGNRADNDSSIASSSSKATEEATVREVNTEDEDTVEGPFFEADELDDGDEMSEFIADEDMMNFNDMVTQGTDDNVDNGEMFIDAEAFEFLLNQNKSNMVVDSGKESLFLKFDPLFAKRISSDGVLAALNKVQKRQSTPKRISKAPSIDVTYCDKISTGSLNLDATTDVNSTIENNVEDSNTTVSKPMMVVNPAVNSIISPRNKPIVTPPRTNRRSLTFTSPAIAVIDRLLSLSGNNSMLNSESPTRQDRRGQNETDIALTQLRELLAEKEIHVHNLRMESKELKERLCSLENQVKSLESESEQRLRKVNEMNERLVEKTNINRGMAAVVEEYERTIASLIAETEQDRKRHAEERMRLVSERDEQTAHLASMEYSFNDLHSKYEKSKQVILTYKANEDTYRKSIKEFEESLLKMQNNYELLKQHATSKLNQANQELERLNRAHEAEVLKLSAMIKRKELHVTSLEETLAQKTKANEELTAICDELINKVG